MLEWDDLVFHELLGSGAFGDVYKGLYQGDIDVAIKRMRSGLIDSNGFANFEREVFMLSKVRHRNIVRFLGFSIDPCLVLVMEFVDGGTLDAFISTQEGAHVAEFTTVMRVLTGIARAIAYMHAVEPKPIIHRDIKCENVLLTKKMEAKLTDLGEAVSLERSKQT